MPWVGIRKVNSYSLGQVKCSYFPKHKFTTITKSAQWKLKGKKTLKKSIKTHSATDLTLKTELPDIKGVRFFVLPFWAYSWRIF